MKSKIGYGTPKVTVAVVPSVNGGNSLTHLAILRNPHLQLLLPQSYLFAPGWPFTPHAQKAHPQNNTSSQKHINNCFPLHLSVISLFLSPRYSYENAPVHRITQEHINNCFPLHLSVISLFLSPRYSYENAPIQKELEAIEVGRAAAFLLSPMASAITGHVLFVDNGLNTMGLALDSKTLERK